MIRTYGNNTSLTQQDSLVLLLAICSSEEPLSYNDLRVYVNSVTAVSHFLDAAEDDGLIDIEVLSKPVRRFRITPTAMGREIGTMLALVDSLVAPGKETKEKSINMRYAELVMRSILAHEPMKQCEVLEIVTNYETATSLLGALEEDGLIVSRKDDEATVGRPAKVFLLTPTGRTVANAYKTIFNRIDARRPRMDGPGAS